MYIEWLFYVKGCTCAHSEYPCVSSADSLTHYLDLVEVQIIT